MVPRRGSDLRGARGALIEPDRRVFVVFNPASGRGRGARRIEAYRRLLDRHLPGYSHAVTAEPGDEYHLTDRALELGFDTIVAVGGDGTWSHVADRLLASGREGLRLGLLPSGTGNDFGRNLGLEYRDPEAAVRALAGGRSVAVDVGRVITPSAPAVPGAAGRRGPARARHFLNLVGFGFDIAVIDAAAGARFLKGELLYKVTALQQLFRFPGVDVAVSAEGGFERRGRYLMVTVTNGKWFGGGFPITPEASVHDGLLHACLIGDAPPLTRARLFDRAGKGRHVESDRVEIESRPSFEVAFDGPVRFEADGDVYETDQSAVRVEVLPGALEVLAPA